MFEKPSFLDIARLVVALIAILGGGSMLFWLPDRIDPSAVFSVIMLVIGYYFGATSEQVAQRRKEALKRE